MNYLFTGSFICISIIHEKSKVKHVFDMKMKASHKSSLVDDPVTATFSRRKSCDPPLPITPTFYTSSPPFSTALITHSISCWVIFVVAVGRARGSKGEGRGWWGKIRKATGGGQFALVGKADVLRALGTFPNRRGGGRNCESDFEEKMPDEDVRESGGEGGMGTGKISPFCLCSN